MASARFASRGAFRTAGVFASSRARTPVTAGQAIEVPLIGACPAGTVETTPTPAPVTSRAAPTFEKAAKEVLRGRPEWGGHVPGLARLGRERPLPADRGHRDRQVIRRRVADRLAAVVARGGQDHNAGRVRLRDRLLDGLVHRRQPGVLVVVEAETHVQQVAPVLDAPPDRLHQSEAGPGVRRVVEHPVREDVGPRRDAAHSGRGGTPSGDNACKVRAMRPARTELVLRRPWDASQPAGHHQVRVPGVTDLRDLRFAITSWLRITWRGSHGVTAPSEGQGHISADLSQMNASGNTNRLCGHRLPP